MKLVDNFMPFDGKSIEIKKIPTAKLVSMYKDKCNQDVARHFHGITHLSMHECTVTGMRFWRPASVAGDAKFYEELSHKWQEYYQTERWEYSEARRAISKPGSRVIEVGCGRGYFLKSLELLGHFGLGAELNADAAINKVTRFDIRTQYADEIALTEPESFDIVCSFQVLEHVPDPRGFIDACVRLARPGGKIILSTPNYDSPTHSDGLDAFDLPPHHLNHFTADTYKRIAQLFGLKVLHICSQIDTTPRFQVKFSNKDTLIEKNIRWNINKTLRLVFGQRDFPGHTILAVLLKPPET